LDQVRNQVVAALELHVDLREGVLEAVAQRHQAVVDGDRPDREGDDDPQKNPEAHVYLPVRLTIPRGAPERGPKEPITRPPPRPARGRPERWPGSPCRARAGR